MAYLLDTHTIIWFLENDPRLSPGLLEILINSDSRLFVSDLSFWEISIKKSLGKLRLSVSTDVIVEEIERQGMDRIPLQSVHFPLLEKLPFHHRDPFDRMLIAQAQHADLTIISRDRSFKSYDVAVLWE